MFKAILSSFLTSLKKSDDSSENRRAEELEENNAGRKRSLSALEASVVYDTTSTIANVGESQEKKRRRIVAQRKGVSPRLDVYNDCGPLSDSQLDTVDLDGPSHSYDELNPMNVESSSLLLREIPTEIIQKMSSYLTSGRDHYSLQLTCQKFHKVSNTPQILRHVDLNGENTSGRQHEDGKGTILYGIELPDVAIEKLYKYAIAGNLQALYMIGMIAAYCHGDNLGVIILQKTADMGYLRAAYTLGLILRDSDKSKSDKYLQMGISKSYLPSCQELLSSQEVKDKFGDLTHTSLNDYFDPIALNRLLGRTYLQSNGVRGVSTSHCWNPNCGRWALKATQSHSRTPQLSYPSRYLPPLQPHLEASLVKLVETHSKTCDVACSFMEEDSTVCNQNCSDMENNTENHLTTRSTVPRCMTERSFRVSRMKMCSSCRRAKYCSKLCQVFDWRSGRHKMECQYL